MWHVVGVLQLALQSRAAALVRDVVRAQAGGALERHALDRYCCLRIEAEAGRLARADATCHAQMLDEYVHMYDH